MLSAHSGKQVCQSSSDPRLAAALRHVAQFYCDDTNAGWILRCAMDDVLAPARTGKAAITSAIELGVPFFNKGMTAVCASIYMRTGEAQQDTRVRSALATAQQQQDHLRNSAREGGMKVSQAGR